MSKFICIDVECGFHDYHPVYINPAHIASIEENYDHKVRVKMCNGEFYDTCYSLSKFMGSLNGDGGTDG